MLTVGFAFALMGVAFLVTTLVYPHVLSFAINHHIVDNPNARKLQRVPVPVMGGTTVFIGLLVAVIIGCVFAPSPEVVKIMALLFVMYLLGVWDDVKDVSAAFRFAAEMFVVWMMMILLGVEINDFHGLWGLYEIEDLVSIPLSLIAGVGIMNAINLIDGVDGYCSTYGVMACFCFAIIFYYAGDMTMFTLALIAIGALIPFFFHNVFGKTSKMFLGDGGSLMLGTLLAIFTFSVLSKDSPCAQYADDGVSLVALVLAILAVPVFDTLKVMIFRVVKGRSPFHPDKTHLHHLFIELNYSHLITSAIIVTVNALIIVACFVSWKLGASIDWQVYIVIACSLLFTWGYYFYMEHEHRKNDGAGSAVFQRACKRGKATNFTNGAAWKFLRGIVDSRILGGKAAIHQEASQKPERPDPRIK